MKVHRRAQSSQISKSPLKRQEVILKNLLQYKSLLKPNKSEKTIEIRKALHSTLNRKKKRNPSPSKCENKSSLAASKSFQNSLDFNCKKKSSFVFSSPVKFFQQSKIKINSSKIDQPQPPQKLKKPVLGFGENLKICERQRDSTGKNNSIKIAHDYKKIAIQILTNNLQTQEDEEYFHKILSVKTKKKHQGVQIEEIELIKLHQKSILLDTMMEILQEENVDLKQLLDCCISRIDLEYQQSGQNKRIEKRRSMGHEDQQNSNNLRSSPKKFEKKFDSQGIKSLQQAIDAISKTNLGTSSLQFPAANKKAKKVAKTSNLKKRLKLNLDIINSEEKNLELTPNDEQHHPRQVEKQLEYEADKNLVLDSVEEDQLSKMDTESYIIHEQQPFSHEHNRHALQVSRIPTEQSYSECSEIVQFNRCNKNAQAQYRDHNKEYDDGEDNGQVPELLDFCNIQNMMHNSPQFFIL